MDIKRFLSPEPIWLFTGMALVRIILGSLIIYHGLEIFDRELMNSYLAWGTFKNSYGKLMVYAGKAFELMAGILLLLGLFTRIGAIMLMMTLSFITFFVGNGRFWYEDQHPFMFVLLGLVFFLYGPGAWSIDSWLRNRNERH